MLRKIQKFFAKSRPKADDLDLLEQLRDADIFVIAATESEGIDASTLTADGLLAELRKALERDQENQQTGYGLFVYSTAGQRRLPFFTTDEHAQIFCGEFSKERNRDFPFMVLETKGSFLGKITSTSCDVVVMNDKSPAERVLSAHELAAARRMWG